ncbi:MAG: CaiB/BaiF CoA-transferase family protein [Proteobacteria bacterium]|nr:CaiB/BaiF CoA-transferase family protein [Pseudomonadota bacterium]
MSKHIFSGLKVIDCATVIAAPAAAMVLADFGADVIKIEQPGEGDMLRLLSHIPTTPNAGNDWFWQMDGRNKRSLAVDLKAAEGLAILHELVVQADVFITNHPYPVRESLGLTFDDLKKLNPGLIYASLTAYGEKGPERNRKGFDQLAYWARSGLMDLMRERGTRPTQGLPGMGDHPTGIALYAGIVTALLHRERTGEGGMVQTSLLANGLWSASGIAQGALAGGDMPAYREANRSSSAMFRVYRTRDDRWLQFNMVRNEELLSLTFAAMEALHLLTDERFASLELMWLNRQALGDEIQAIIGRKTADEWMTLFGSHNLPVNKVAIVEEVVSDEQIKANGMAVPPIDDDVDVPWIINHPIQISSVPQVGPRRAPGLGEHGAQILAELGYTDKEISDLRNRGVIEWPG